MTVVDHLSESEVAGYLAGALTPELRRKIEIHLEGCPECRLELIAVSRLVAEPAVSKRRSPWARRASLLVPIAVAASLAGLVVVRSHPRPTDTVSAERLDAGPLESLPRIDVIGPTDGESVAGPRITFTWRARSADSYRLTLLTETGEPVWTTDTPDSTASVPATIRLEPGGLYFWRVEAIAEGISATSGIHRFQVSR